MRDLRIIEVEGTSFFGHAVILYRVIEFGEPACYFEHSQLFSTREAAEAYIEGMQVDP